MSASEKTRTRTHSESESHSYAEDSYDYYSGPKKFPFGLKPPPHRQRKSNYLPEVPKVLYSKAAAEFNPPADYQGPRKSMLQKPPDPSLNPKKISLPILSVSKLTIQTPESALPPVQGKTKKGKARWSQQHFLDFEGCQETKKILLGMPSAIQKHFRSEIADMQQKKRKRPCHGRVKQFVHFNFHDPDPPPEISLNGIVVLGGDHRNMIEEEPKEPGTPPPLSGRIHCQAQTEIYVENIMDNEAEMRNAEMQCEPVHDDSTDNPKEPIPLLIPKDGTGTISTQFDDGGQSEIAEAYEQVSTNLVDAVIMESLKQLMEEHELEALRKQHDLHRCLRHREILLLEKCKKAQAKYEEQKRYLDSRKPWDEDLDNIIQQVGMDKVRANAPSHFNESETDLTIRDVVQNEIMPPIKAQIRMKVGMYKLSRTLLDTIIEETCLKREMDYNRILEFEVDASNPNPHNSIVTSEQEDEAEEEEATTVEEPEEQEVDVEVYVEEDYDDDEDGDRERRTNSSFE